MVEQHGDSPTLGNLGASPGPVRSGQTESTLDALAWALRMADAGYFMAPVVIRRHSGTGRKRPDYLGAALGAGWDEVATRDPDVIRSWRDRYGPNVSFLVACEPSGIVAADLDLKGAKDKDGRPVGPGGLEWWSRSGLPISPMVVETPGGGQHHYWRQPDAGSLANSQGRIHAGVDIRGAGGHVFAPGSRVVGDDVSYRLVDPIIAPGDLPEMPDEIVKLIPDGARVPRQHDGQAGRIHDEQWVIAECMRQRDAVAGHLPIEGAGFRSVLRGASLVMGRAVAAGLVPRWRCEEVLSTAVSTVWGQPNADDQEWIATGLDDGIATPWTVVATRDEALQRMDAPASLDGASVADTGSLEDVALANEVAKLERRRLAQRIVDARERRPLRRLSAREFLAAPQPVYRVPGLLYEDSLAVVFGPPGSAKTFFMLDLALCMATGRLWRGQVMVPRTRVHYLMAEGQAVNVGRTLAWLTHHGVDDAELDGWFDAFPEPVTLTPEGVGAYLAEVEADQPGLIVLDTKHAMLSGDESKSADIKIMRDALDSIRRVCGSTVVLVDHTGLTHEDRARGSNSQKAMIATEVKLTVTGSVRTAEITRNTAGMVAGRWSFTLEPVPDAPRPVGTDVPVVPLPADRGVELAASVEEYWTVPRDQLPTKVGDLAGAAGSAAHDVFRALVAARDRDGLSVPALVTLLKDCPRPHSRTNVYNAVTALSEAGVIEHAHGGKSWVLVPSFDGWKPGQESAT